MTSRKPSRTTELVPLKSTFQPGPGHVICAKGRSAKRHSSNVFLKSLVQAHLSEYSSCPSKLERSFIVSKIINLVRSQIDPKDGSPGGFVRLVDGIWYDINDRNAREKIGQSFRDSLHTQFKSSTKAKARKSRSRGQLKQRGHSAAVATTITSGNVSSVCTSCSSSRSSTPLVVQTVSSFPIQEVQFVPNEGWQSLLVPSSRTANASTTAAACVTPCNISKPFKTIEEDTQLSELLLLEPLPLTEAISMDFDGLSHTTSLESQDDSVFCSIDMDQMFMGLS